MKIDAVHSSPVYSSFIYCGNVRHSVAAESDDMARHVIM